jgi:hypothetical protein
MLTFLCHVCTPVHQGWIGFRDEYSNVTTPLGDLQCQNRSLDLDTVVSDTPVCRMSGPRGLRVVVVTLTPPPPSLSSFPFHREPKSRS